MHANDHIKVVIKVVLQIILEECQARECSLIFDGAKDVDHGDLGEFCILAECPHQLHILI